MNRVKSWSPKTLPREIYVVTLIFWLYLAMWAFGTFNSLDARFFYSAEEAWTFLNGLSHSQVNVYFRNELIDLLLIGSYTYLFFLLAQRLFPSERLRWYTLVPGLFDLLETLAVIYLLTYPPGAFHLGWLGIATLLKWSTGGVIVLMLLYGYWRQQRSQRLA